jgi:hypothetical protein
MYDNRDQEPIDHERNDQRIAGLEAELAALKAAQAESRPPESPAVIAEKQLPAAYRSCKSPTVPMPAELPPGAGQPVGSAATWRPARQKKINPEKLIWGSNPPHRRHRFPRIGA